MTELATKTITADNRIGSHSESSGTITTSCVRGTAPCRYHCRSPSCSASRILAARSCVEKGFWMKWTPSSEDALVRNHVGGVARREQALSIRGWSDRRPFARSRPFISGMTTSVTSRWISPAYSLASRMASPGPAAGSTWFPIARS